MAIPTYSEVMQPLLDLIADKQEYTLTEVTEALAQHFKLSADERRLLLPSGKQRAFDNRVGWARTYLKKGGLVEYTGAGRFRITNRGVETLRERPQNLMAYLRRYEEFREFLNLSQIKDGQQLAVESGEQTPEELLESSYNRLRQQLAIEILDAIKSCPPSFFEKLVVNLLVTMGYGGSLKDAGQSVGQSGDGGIDGVIKEDKLGLDVVYIQAKRWEGTVGRPVVQSFAGSLEGHQARKGVLITTSEFSREAKDYVGRIEKRIVLVDGQQLIQLMIDHSVGVTETATYVVRKIDWDFFAND